MKLQNYFFFACFALLFFAESIIQASQVQVTKNEQALGQIIDHSLNFVLLEAAKNNDYGTIIWLFSQDSIPYIEAKNKGGSTALMIAAADGYDYIVEYLITVGANVEIRELFDNTPLVLAARNGHAAVVAQLLAAHANLKAINFQGYSALMLAAQNNHMDIIEKLVAAGADLTTGNKKDGNKTARDYATDKEVYGKAVIAGLAAIMSDVEIDEKQGDDAEHN